MKKILSPEEVLVAVMAHYANTQVDCDPDSDFSASFLDDDGSVVLEFVPRKEDKNLAALN